MYLIIRLRFIESTILVVVHVVAKVSLHEIGSDFGQLFFLYLMVSLYAGHGAYTYEKVFFCPFDVFVFFILFFFLVLKKKNKWGKKKGVPTWFPFAKGDDRRRRTYSTHSIQYASGTHQQKGFFFLSCFWGEGRERREVFCHVPFFFLFLFFHLSKKTKKKKVEEEQKDETR